MFGAVAASTCPDCGCGTPGANTVVLTAYIATWITTTSTSTLSDPTDPVLFPGGMEETWPEPPCTPPDVDVACEPNCSISASRPELQELECPDPPGGLDAPRRWGTTTFTVGATGVWFDRRPINVPFDSSADESTSVNFYMTPVGGGAEHLVSVGTGVSHTDIFINTDNAIISRPEQPADSCTECIALSGSTSFNLQFKVTWRPRKVWTVPPPAMTVAATAGGRTVEVTATEVIVKNGGTTLLTWTLGTGTLGDVRNAIDALTSITATNASANMATHPDALLVVMAATAIPTSGSLPLPIANVGDEINMPGTQDQNVQPSWTVQYRTMGSGGAYTTVYAIGFHRFTSTEVSFADGCRADYDNVDFCDLYAGAGLGGGWNMDYDAPCADVGAGAKWAQPFTEHEGTLAKFVYPRPCDASETISFGPVSGSAAQTCCKTVSDTETTPAWDQDPGDCWVGCVTGASQIKAGYDLIWMIERV